ncbi:uncharacterized protein LOC108022910 isoform X2 [Drosophila biarmipes]|uniref:uncharacterized protein LOC108022910 isoform X2 n=1 Tax=Drosophila biarmipes TaxID=125945 RepID=UPI0007E7B18F|nr:uncharacterized protein LOC108022910 isoform X2 [Drosophila biarmipes]XP_043948204.1 uncharacterized protein LOC108022910 isoform X2 [Drosophila biarmipes]XP_050743163.1 uncharacterized protein LOC108022910 isoform X2 [Drosophila biarmipes]XP_050743164.1 uncharacterized protein LOC108022910 isoform X2 [Drosophila biarmipes]XP_050743165.1 uncharacterized protein LOC108022910 isoform X2 [Drosophila biarmipes]
MKSIQLLAAAVCLAATLILGTQAQENAMLQIPPSLVECYNTSFFMNRDNRLPANMDTLISLIEKVENSYAGTSGVQADIRTVAVSLLHRFRQDGIKKAAGVNPAAGVIPYSPTGFQFPKFKILLSRLIPGNANSFPNSSLTRVERCSLHFMLSSTFDTRSRGDENNVCNQLSQYRAQRLPRSLKKNYGNNFISDVEWLDSRPKRGRSSVSVSKYEQLGELDYESDWAYAGSEGTSQCPVEDGLVRTRWGTVSAGTLIAGIAAGVQQQTVQLRTLLALSSQRRSRGRSQSQTSSGIDNRWAATLAGDLAEVTLVQLPVSGGSASVGATGGWNDTVLPHWYFLSQRNNLEATDAEIRGGLDGLILAKNVASWRTQASSLKLSQLLRMYYSTNGVLSTGINACSRQSQFTNVAPSQELEDQTYAFASVLDSEMQLRVTLTPSVISQYAGNATASLVTYVPIFDYFPPQEWADISNRTTVMADIFVFVDTYWPYRCVVDYVAYVLQDLNIHPYASKVTIFAASDGSVIVNTTDYIINVYEEWNSTSHSWHPTGFNLPLILNSLSVRVEDLLEADRAIDNLGGRSLVALLIPSPLSYVDEKDYDYCQRYMEQLRWHLPNLHFIYYGGGALVRFHDFVRDPSKDLFLLNTEKPPEICGDPVITRVRQVPRRLSNPRCYANGVISEFGINSLQQYARLGSINFYRLDSLYLPARQSMRYLKISPISKITFTVCTSRSIERPFRNLSAPLRAEETCESTALGSFSYDLTDACVGYDFEPCPPLFFSVQAQGFGDISCVVEACQTPDEAQYVVSLSNLGCNDATAIISNVVLAAPAFLISLNAIISPYLYNL